MPIITPTSQPLDIIIMAGQSNMEGNGLGCPEKAYKPTPDILMMNGKLNTRVEKKAYGNAYLVVDYSKEYTIGVADERTEGNLSRYSLALRFAELYKRNDLKEGRGLLLLQTSVGGTGFAKGHGGVGGTLSERMLDMVSEALKMNSQNRVVAFLWHQGEHDAYEGAALSKDELRESYENGLSTLISRTRAAIGEVPFISAGFTHCWMLEYPEQNEIVLSVTERLCSELNKAAFIRNTLDLSVNDELVSDGDTVHFSRPALITLGERYYEAFSKIKDKD